MHLTDNFCYNCTRLKGCQILKDLEAKNKISIHLEIENKEVVDCTFYKNKNMKEIQGNLIDLFFEGQFDAIGHGCNIKRNFGAGIAKEIKQRIPEAYQADLESNKPHKYNIPATYSSAKTDFGTVLNLYTQIHWGKSNIRVIANEKEIGRQNNTFGKQSSIFIDIDISRYYYIMFVLRKINKDFAGKKIGLPLIGCGYAGLDWNNVKPIIAQELKDCDVTIVHFQK
jgi:O-acetyl-ADP-ribose deacetylase (regulator of RNase III)